ADDLIGFFVGQGLQKRRIDDAEDRGIHPDANRQCKNDDSCEDGTFLQRSEAVTQILEGLLFKPPRLHRERIPKGAQAPPEDIRPAAPFTVMKFSLPLLLPVRTKPPRNQRTQDTDDGEVKSHA